MFKLLKKEIKVVIFITNSINFRGFYNDLKYNAKALGRSLLKHTYLFTFRKTTIQFNIFFKGTK